jgi:hypothetical protein
VKSPAADVDSEPLPEEELPSVQLEMPGPPTVSVQLKLVGTLWPTRYVAPVEGAAIVAMGGPGVVVTVCWACPAAR